MSAVVLVIFLSASQAVAAKITVAGGSVGGTWSIFTEGVAEAIRRGNPDYIVTAEPGKDGPNCIVLSQGKVQAALAYLPTAIAAVRGEAPYSSALPDIKRLMNFASHGFQIIATEKSGFSSLQDMVKAVKDGYPLKISVNKKGSLMEMLTKAAFEVNGLTYADIEKAGGSALYNLYPEALDMMSTGQMDALSGISELPTNFFLEAAGRVNLRFLDIDEATIEKINAKLFTSALEVPAGVYSFQPQEVSTVGAPMVLIASAKLSEEMAYNITRAVCENLDFLRTVHVSLSDLTVDIMSKDEALELHPGAAKWYREYRESGSPK